MGGPARYDVSTTVRAEGVTVERDLTCEETGIAGTITIHSDRSDPVVVHAVDGIPRSLPVDEVAFSPGTEPEAGAASPERVDVRQTVTDEPVRVSYGIFLSGRVGSVDWDRPDILDVSTVVDGGYTETTDCPPESDTGQSGTPTSGVPARFDRDDVATDGSGEPDAADAASGRSSPPVGEDAVAEPVLGRKTVVVRDRGTDDRDSPPAEGGDLPRHVEVRLDRLSTRVEKFAAYATSLEEIIAEHGTGTEFVDRFESGIDDLDDRVAACHAEVDALRNSCAEDVGTLRHTIGHVDRDVDRLDDELDRLGSTVGDHDDALGDVRRDVDTVAGRLDDVADDQATIRETLDTVAREIESVSGEIQSLRVEFDALRDEVQSFESFRKSLAEISNVDGE